MHLIFIEYIIKHHADVFFDPQTSHQHFWNLLHLMQFFNSSMVLGSATKPFPGSSTT